MDGYVKLFRFTGVKDDEPYRIEKVLTWIEAVEFTAILTQQGYTNVAIAIV